MIQFIFFDTKQIAYVVILCYLSKIILIVWVGKKSRYYFKSVWVCLFLKCRRHYVNHIVTQVLACLSIHGVNIVHIRSVIGGHLFVQAVICMYPYCTSVCPHLLFSVWEWAQSCMCVRKKPCSFVLSFVFLM